MRLCGSASYEWDGHKGAKPCPAFDRQCWASCGWGKDPCDHCSAEADGAACQHPDEFNLRRGHIFTNECDWRGGNHPVWCPKCDCRWDPELDKAELVNNWYDENGNYCVEDN